MKIKKIEVVKEYDTSFPGEEIQQFYKPNLPYDVFLKIEAEDGRAFLVDARIIKP